MGVKDSQDGSVIQPSAAKKPLKIEGNIGAGGQQYLNLP